MSIYMLIVLAFSGLMEGERNSVNEGRLWDNKFHDINNVEMYIRNNGTIGQNEAGGPGCWWPTGSGQYYIWGAGIWFGVRDSVASDSVDTLVSVCYGPHSGNCEFGAGLSGHNPYAEYVEVYMYPAPWPAPVDTFPMAPQEIVSHQDSWCCYNDSNPIFHSSWDTRPIGIEIYQTVYAWDQSPIQDIIFLVTEIKNVSEDTLHDCYAAICVDSDIGNESAYDGNDICAGIIDRWYVVDGESLRVDGCAYQWQEEEESGWVSYPGVFCCDLLQTPFDLVPGEDKDNDGIPDQYECDSTYYWNHVPQNLWDVDGDNIPDWRDPSQWPQFGVTAMKQFTLSYEPNMDNEYYRFLAGYHWSSGQYQPYDTLPSQPEERRFLLSSGPFSLRPDSSSTLIFAFMFADWYGLYETPDTAVALIDQYAQEWYDMYWHLTIEEYSDNSISSFFSIMPNPAIDRTHVQFNMVQPGHVSIKVYNSAGQIVQHVVDEKRSAGQHTVVIRTDGLSSGTYFTMLETGSHMETRSFVVMK